MINKDTEKKRHIDRRQFIIKTAISVCGLSAACGTYKAAFSSNNQLDEPYPHSTQAVL